MTKKKLRLLYRSLREKLTEKEINEMSQQIFSRFIETFKFEKGMTAHLFLSIEHLKEVNTEPFIQYFFENEINIVVPKVIDDQLISVLLERNTPLEKSFWGVPEPTGTEDFGTEKIDFVLVPVMYADSQGNRVGYGKGFYDTFFRTTDQKIVKIGLNFFSPDEPVDDAWEFDVPLDYLVTPTEVVSFATGSSKLTK